MQESSFSGFVIFIFLFSTVNPDRQSARIPKGVLEFKLTKPPLNQIEGTAPPRQVSAIVGIDEDATSIE